MVNTDRLCMGCMNDNGGEKLCPICGYDSSEDNAVQHLSVGSWLNANRYLVGKVTEEGGDGVTYIGWDNDLNAVVNIREYFPEGLAKRSGDRMTVSPETDRGIPFARGMEEFTTLFTKLAEQPQSASILRVIDVFEANGTVYAVQSTVSGTTLKAFLIRNGGSLKWDQVKPLFMPLLATLSDLNDAGIYHLGISPDSIIVGRDGKLRLTGFGIASARTEHTEFITRLNAGYAAPEQYLENEECAAPCDVYAMGAVIFRCLIGTTPPDAKERLAADKLSIPAKIAEIVPKGALVAVANTLKVDKNDRIASADRLRRMLDAVSGNTVMLGAGVSEENEGKKSSVGGKKYAVLAAVITAAIFLLIIGVLVLVFKDTLFGTPSEPVDTTNPSSNISAPDKPQIGDVDSTISQPGEKLYVVPDYTGYTFNDIIRDESLASEFEIVVAGTEYSNTVERGYVCKQTQPQGAKLPRDTEIGVYISLGPSTITMPNLVGLNKDEAYIKLLEMGFFKSNIEFIEVSDDSADYGEVVSTSIKAYKTVSTNDSITIEWNAAEPETDISSNDSSASDN